MKRGFLACLASWLILFPLQGQFTADFSDGSLAVWQGDVPHFTVNAGHQLQLNAPSGSTQSWLYTPVAMTDSMVWEIYLRLDFAPSTSNQLRLYLGLSDPDISTASGYYIEIGASGDMDAVDLKYADQGNGQLIASSSPGLVSAEPVELSVRIVRNGQGLWSCYKTGPGPDELLFSVTHTLLPLANLDWFGLHCRYTETRRDKFFFDDIRILPLVADTIAPEWLSLEVLSGTRLKLQFNETLDPQSAMDSQVYTLQPGGQHPEAVTVQQHEIELDFPSPFENQIPYTLHIEGIRDIAGNQIETLEKSFIHFIIDQALENEILITEIMADPTPVIGLPDAEYIELYNPSLHLFQLSDYTLEVGSSARSLPDHLLFAGEYIILCDDDDESRLSSYGTTLSISSLPALTNSGARVALIRNSGEIVHDVTYSSSWYRDAGKSEGGWSLEMQNPLHVCSDADNWSAAENLVGGTPGQINSRWNLTPDIEGPSFVSLFIPTASQVQLRFSEKLDGMLMENINAYSIIPPVSVSSALLTEDNTVELQLSSPLQPDIIYTLLPVDVYDCLGNLTPLADSIRFGLVVQPQPGDLLVNEILFNPATGGNRFIELINTSQKFIDLGNIAIARIHPSGQDIYPTGLTEIMAPGDIVALSPEPEDIQSRYTVPVPQRLFSASLPSWDDKTDHVAIISEGMILDSFTYQSSWHHPVIADQNGVSLERISVTSPSSLSSTWHSAAAIWGFATPTGANSQQFPQEENPAGPYSIVHSRFSPNGDGYQDFLALNFQLGSGDWIGTIRVYDLEGREIVRLASNDSFGTNALFQWDGRDASGTMADMGIYILFIQLWDVDGRLQEYQETCALINR